LLATSRCNGIWETTRQQTQRTFASADLLQLVADLLRGNWCRLMDFCFIGLSG